MDSGPGRMDGPSGTTFGDTYESQQLSKMQWHLKPIKYDSIRVPCEFTVLTLCLSLYNGFILIIVNIFTSFV